jgi:hypothetical protein
MIYNDVESRFASLVADPLLRHTLDRPKLLACSG